MGEISTAQTFHIELYGVRRCYVKHVKPHVLCKIIDVNTRLYDLLFKIHSGYTPKNYDLFKVVENRMQQCYAS